MRPADLSELERRLGDLAEALGGRAPSKAALRVWLDTLAECDAGDVWPVLTEWPKSHGKPPLPAEALKAARELAAARRERVAAADRDAGKAFSPAALRGDPRSPAYQEFRAALAALKARSRPSGKAWAWRLRERELAGERLNEAQRQNWRAALRGDGAAAIDRGDDDEARREREAIMAEGGDA